MNRHYLKADHILWYFCMTRNKPFNYFALREKCPNAELFLVCIFLYSDWIRRFTRWISVLSENAEKYGPEITPYLDTFHAVLFNSNLPLRRCGGTKIYKLLCQEIGNTSNQKVCVDPSKHVLCHESGRMLKFY